MLTSDGVIKLSDLGLALRSEDSTVDSERSGTWDYMAPELHSHAPESKASDIFALGIVMFELCFKRKPFLGVIQCIQGHLVEYPRERYSTQLTDLVLACLQKQPQLRLTIESVCQEVDALLEINKVDKNKIGEEYQSRRVARLLSAPVVKRTNLVDHVFHENFSQMSISRKEKIKV